MESPEAVKRVRINRWLPYWAVFQADVRQTTQSWIYRGWVLASLFAAIGYLLYRVGVYREAGLIQTASTLVSDILRWCVIGSATLIIVLTAGSISAERGTVADSVLSRGISRYQYFLGKWHSRLLTLLGTFIGIGMLTLLGGMLLLPADLSILGSLMALAAVTACMAMVISGGVAMSAIFNSSLVAIAILWMTLYGLGFLVSMLPAHYPSPPRLLASLPEILRGEYNYHSLSRFIGWSLVVSCILAIAGLGYFARRDV